MADRDPTYQADCLFCRIAAGEIPADIVFQDETVVLFDDINPKAPTHVLAIPRRHLASAADLTDADGDLLAALFGALRCAPIRRRRGGAEGLQDREQRRSGVRAERVPSPLPPARWPLDDLAARLTS